MNTTQIIPNYSLADLFRDINNGVVNQFIYNGNKFFAQRNGLKWIVTDPKTNFTATQNGCVNSMTDLQGLASCLKHYNRSLIFNNAGDIIN